MYYVTVFVVIVVIVGILIVLRTLANVSPDDQIVRLEKSNLEALDAETVHAKNNHVGLEEQK